MIIPGCSVCTVDLYAVQRVYNIIHRSHEKCKTFFDFIIYPNSNLFAHFQYIHHIQFTDTFGEHETYQHRYRHNEYSGQHVVDHR